MKHHFLINIIRHVHDHFVSSAFLKIKSEQYFPLLLGNFDQRSKFQQLLT